MRDNEPEMVCISLACAERIAVPEEDWEQVGTGACNHCGRLTCVSGCWRYGLPCQDEVRIIAAFEDSRRNRSAPDVIAYNEAIAAYASAGASAKALRVFTKIHPGQNTTPLARPRTNRKPVFFTNYCGP